jgi:RNase adapter protein RapZ
VSRAGSARRPEVLIITGLSGSGKTHAARALEDMGWFCVDNLPTALILPFADLIRESSELRRSALVVDIRERKFLEGFPAVCRQLRRRPLGLRLLFLEAEDKILLRRFSETRRPHPLAVNEPVAEGIREERAALRPIRAMADHILDTSEITVHELRQWVRDSFGPRPEQAPFVVTVVSFGYKYGVPSDADLVFDVRFLPNPHFEPGLRSLTGKHPRVVRFMNQQPETPRFLRHLGSLLRYLLPQYMREGKSYLTIAVGCTGGRHRSVMLAEALATTLGGPGRTVRVRHRDMRL